MSCGVRLRSRPRTAGTMQYAHTQLHPTEICTHAWCGRSRLAGRVPENAPSKLNAPTASIRSRAMSSPSRETSPGPKAMSTKGYCSNTIAFWACAQQPPTATTTSGFSRLMRRASPRLPVNRSSALPRIVQVLNRMRSAPSRVSDSRYPIDSSSPFIRSESWSFIWQPKLVRW